MEQKELEKMAMHYANTRLGHFTSSCVSWLFSCMRDSDGTQNGAQLDALPQRMWQISGSEDASESHRGCICRSSLRCMQVVCKVHASCIKAIYTSYQ